MSMVEQGGIVAPLPEARTTARESGAAQLGGFMLWAAIMVACVAVTNSKLPGWQVVASLLGLGLPMLALAGFLRWRGRLTSLAVISQTLGSYSTAFGLCFLARDYMPPALQTMFVGAYGLFTVAFWFVLVGLLLYLILRGPLGFHRRRTDLSMGDLFD
ncbi:hypothetical protein QO010_004673 [Caulobacter ginsengisoli]|uniref:Uncharacterized protein n=1 Tax=Caulobacter ginsengisoli TaxID=400775 RepID=A0ABU0IZZ7_9CAUL|nr:hypothetical protein [Caulobacter ginsengisoli]MDQ0466876.1 hypothetical protein [Caulobacter ginsengisoli]